MKGALLDNQRDSSSPYSGSHEEGAAANPTLLYFIIASSTVGVGGCRWVGVSVGGCVSVVTVGYVVSENAVFPQH